MADTVRETLLELSNEEKHERRKARIDYNFYKGPLEDRKKATLNKELMGQSWENEDNVDYTPTQEIRNRVKPLLRKQARWMFGKEPTLVLHAYDKKDKQSCEDLRKFIDDILKQNKFWSNTRKAFLMSTIKKRVLLRAASPKDSKKIKLRYEDIDNFSYEEIDGQITQVKFFQEDLNNWDKDEESEKIYYIHTFSYEKFEDNEPLKASYKVEEYKGDNLTIPVNEVEPKELGFEINKLPVWLIKNGGDLGGEFGESDLHDLKEPQNQYNRRVSDFADSLKFMMFGAEAIIDADKATVDGLIIAPNALHAIKTSDEALENGKQATLQRVEYSMANSEALTRYLDDCKSDMNFMLDMPSISELNNIPSAKAMRYLYNDLIARCEEKWLDWTPVFEELIEYIINVAYENNFDGFKKEWINLKYFIEFKHNYPIPSDEQEAKTLAISEVTNNVRSKKSYIKEYSKDEDAEDAYKEILDELVVENDISMGAYQPASSTIKDDTNNLEDTYKNLDNVDDPKKSLEDEEEVDE